MSSANLDLVRSIYPDWERGDFSSVGWAHVELEYVFADGPSPGTWTGLSGLADSTRDFMGAWEGFRIEADEYRELDGERVLVLLRFGGRGKASGLEIGASAESCATRKSLPTARAAPFSSSTSATTGRPSKPWG